MNHPRFRPAIAVAVALLAGPVAAQEIAVDSVVIDPVPLLPSIPLGPLPPGSRYTFTRDSIQWSGAITLADLLSAIPGVFVARAGFLGQPEYTMYAGRGPGGIEILFDGMPFRPIGPDSVYVDPGTIKVALLNRVDVEILPSRLRVHLVSERHDGTEPRSYLRVMSGAFSTAQYAGAFQQRWANGASLDLGADFSGSDGAPGVTRNDQLTDVWLRAGWIPDARSGAIFEIRRQSQSRDLLPTGTLNSPPERDGTRSESIFRFFSGTRADGFGLRFEGGFGSTRWSDTLGTELGFSQAFGAVRYALPNLQAEVSGWVGDARVLRGSRASASWIPLTGVVISGEGEYQVHPGDRSSRYASGSLGLYKGPLSLVGTLSEREGLQAPALALDTVQITADRSVRLGFSTSRLSGSVSIIERDAYDPLPPTDYDWWPALGLTPKGTYLVADVGVSPVQPLTVSYWYSSPREGGGSGLQPPEHTRWDVTFRTKFWKAFRSGVYDLRASYRIESWGEGVAGVDGTGNPTIMPGVTFHEMYAQIQLVDFMIFWNMRNSQNSLNEYVPGLPYPRIAQTFGVQWTFFN